MRPLIFILTVAFTISVFAQTNTPEMAAVNSPTTFDPVTNYVPHEMEGWHVLVNQKLLAETNLCERGMKILGAQLYQITRVVPAAPLAKLRQIPIWLELDDPLFPGACYHESRDWLDAHGVNPAKTGAVEIANAKHFTTWTIEQPCIVLHELAHGYHHQFLGDDFGGIRRCYEHAQAAELYESILRSNGHHERHYAMNNEKEYFAEMTEAFFGTNDFYPFVRAELKEHDPEMFALLCEVWDVKP